MHPYQQRVIDEKADLDTKIARLDFFIMGDNYKQLMVREQILLKKQQRAMKNYTKQLRERIKLFSVLEA